MAINMHRESPVPYADHMRARRFPLWLLSAVVIAAAGCGSSSVMYLAGPTAASCEASLPASQLSVESTGGRFDTSVTAARECSWTASSNASWLQVTPQTGQGNVMVTVTVSANPDTSGRTAMVVIAGKNLMVVQGAAAAPPPSSPPSEPPSSPPSEPPSSPPSTPPSSPPSTPPVTPPSTPPATPPCSFTISPSSATFDKDGDTKTFAVNTASTCSWTASKTDTWITLLAASGTGNGTVRYKVDKLPGKDDERSGTITVAGLVFRITQTKK
jgi:hypothetical protein